MKLEFLWLVMTLATSPISEQRVLLEAEHCMQWNRDYWAMKKFGSTFEYDWKDGRTRTPITAMACVGADPVMLGAGS